MRCAIWYHLYNLKNLKNNYGGVLILVQLQASACNCTKINTPPWVFFTFFKLCKWYQIAQRIINGVVYSDHWLLFEIILLHHIVCANLCIFMTASLLCLNLGKFNFMKTCWRVYTLSFNSHCPHFCNNDMGVCCCMAMLV